MMGRIYSGFASYYDNFMSDVPYDEWSRKLLGILAGHGISDGIVCDLCCGTGEMTMRLAKAGYDMIGIDISEDMLVIAKDKLYDEEGNETELSSHILYLKQDAREFELFGTVRAIISICDGMNYITDPDDLGEVMRKANNYLDPGGLFVFDMKSDLYFRTEYGDNEFTETDENSGAVLKWKNHYDAGHRLNFYSLVIEEKDFADPEKTNSIREEHVQRAYLPEEVLKAGEEAGMNFVALLDADTMRDADDNTKRYYFVFSEKKQPNKLYI